MSDDRSESGGQDRKRINLGEDYEVRDWAEKFGVTPEELRAVVNQVGDRADDVAKALQS